MRCIGVFRICDEWAELSSMTIKALDEFCDGICFLTHGVKSPYIIDAMNNCLKLLEIKEFDRTGVSQDWGSNDGFNAGVSSIQAYKLADKYGADWVIKPDNDEFLPYKQLKQELRKAEEQGKKCVSFPFLNCWESPERIVNLKRNVTGNHTRAIKGGDKELNAFGGFEHPSGYDPHLIYTSAYPLRHMHMLTDKLRERRQSRRGGIEPWAREVTAPDTYVFDEDWTNDDWWRHCNNGTMIPWPSNQ